MSAAVHTLKAPRGPARAALAEAVARLRAARQALADAEAATGMMEERHRAANDDVYAAEDALREMQEKPSDPQAVVAATLRGEVPKLDRGADKLQRRLDIANEAMRTIREAQEALAASVDDARETVRWAENAAQHARAAVLQESIPALIERSIPLRRELAGICAVLSVLAQEHTSGNPDQAERERRRSAELVAAAIDSRAFAGMNVDVRPWRDAMRRLLDDPDAELPAVPLPN